MRTAVSIWDALFGKKVVIRLPDPRGGIKEVRVTVKWLEQMEREGKFTPADKQYVHVHILDPESELLGMYGLEGGSDSSYRVETWIVGENIPIGQYERFVDPETQALYVVTKYENGKRGYCTVKKDLWDAVRAVSGEK